ncbi:uncharacterized protein V1516DRAFT_670562 [Lipomyces oligophaga]|uniref:uncharacterized protein n=1 Tax=Lipomyces oligophaga TaxID=45792 RepID=UPI0034CF206A
MTAISRRLRGLTSRAALEAVRRASSSSSISKSSTSSASASSASSSDSVDCSDKANQSSSFCQRPTGSQGLAIGLGVAVPVFVIFLILVFFHRYNARRLRKEDDGASFDNNQEDVDLSPTLPRRFGSARAGSAEKDKIYGFMAPPELSTSRTSLESPYYIASQPSKWPGRLEAGRGSFMKRKYSRNSGMGLSIPPPYTKPKMQKSQLSSTMNASDESYEMQSVLKPERALVANSPSHTSLSDSLYNNSLVHPLPSSQRNSRTYIGSTLDSDLSSSSLGETGAGSFSVPSSSPSNSLSAPTRSAIPEQSPFRTPSPLHTTTFPGSASGARERVERSSGVFYPAQSEIGSSSDNLSDVASLTIPAPVATAPLQQPQQQQHQISVTQQPQQAQREVKQFTEDIQEVPEIPLDATEEERVARMRSFYNSYFDHERSNGLPAGQHMVRDDSGVLYDAQGSMGPSSRSRAIHPPLPALPGGRGPRVANGQVGQYEGNIPPYLSVPRSMSSQSGVPLQNMSEYSTNPSSSTPNLRNQHSRPVPPPLLPLEPLAPLPTPHKLGEDDLLSSPTSFAPPRSRRVPPSAGAPPGSSGMSDGGLTSSPLGSPQIGHQDWVDKQLRELPTPHAWRNSHQFSEMEFKPSRPYNPTSANAVAGNSVPVNRMSQYNKDLVAGKDEMATNLRPSWSMRR